MKRAVRIMAVVIAFSLAAISGGAAAELPEGIIVMEDHRMPLSYAVLDDGGFLVSGFEGSLPGGSIHEHMASWSPSGYPPTSKPEALTAFVAVYERDGAERWSYSLPARDAYHMIYPQVLYTGDIACSVQPYDPGMGYSPENAADVFCVDARGNPVERPEWLSPSYLADTLPWLEKVPGGWLLKEKPSESIPAPYTPTLTLYGPGMQRIWTAAPEALDGHFTQSFFPVEGGYVGCAANVADKNAGTPSEILFVIYKLDENGELLWKHSLDKGDWVHGVVHAADGSVLAMGERMEVPPYDHSLPFVLCLDEAGAQKWMDRDLYERNSISGLLFSITDREGNHYVEGHRAGATEQGSAAGYPIILKMDNSGTALSFTRVPDAAASMEKSTFLRVDSQGNAYLTGLLAGDTDKWYILPLESSLFTDEW